MNKGEMNRLEAMVQLVAELDRVYPNGSFDPAALQNEQSMLDFTTAQNGHTRQFSYVAKRALVALALAWTKETPSLAVRVDDKGLLTLLRQTIADLHADGQLGNDGSANLKLLVQTVEQVLQNTKTDFTHSFPARTLGMEANEPYVLGPVTFMSRDQWLDAVDFSEHAKSTYLGEAELNEQWKQQLRTALLRPNGVMQEGETPLPMAATVLYEPIRSCPSLLRVSLSGYERSLSIRAARHISKTALDGLSLVLGGNDLFQQQTLADERMPPIAYHTLVEENGFLYMPGFGNNLQIPLLSGCQVKGLLDQENMRPRLDALAHVLEGLASPASHPHPLLAMRWAVALDWLAEGEREVSEAIAVTKIGTSLDVLTEGGRFGGILNMLTHLTGWEEETEFKIGAYPRNLRWLVKELYDSGRSKILHGNVFDRLQSFAEIRKVGANLARKALIECAIRLRHYTGSDNSKAFRDIPKALPAETAEEP